MFKSTDKSGYFRVKLTDNSGYFSVKLTDKSGYFRVKYTDSSRYPLIAVYFLILYTFFSLYDMQIHLSPQKELITDEASTSKQVRLKTIL